MTRQRKWQIDKVSAGLCRLCGKPAVEGKTKKSEFCLAHLIHVRERAREKHGYKRRTNSLSYRLTLPSKPSQEKPDYKVDYSS